jgi:predicted dehydrogenase
MKTVRWGVIGAGGIADRRTIPGMLLAKNAELVAVMEVNMEFAEKLRLKHGAKRAYDNVDALLADPEIDAVYIATPVGFHKEQAFKAAKAKKHLLIEKPVAMTAAEGLDVARVCREEGVLVSVGLMMRYHPYHQKMKEFVESGKLGRVVSCRGQLTCWYPDIPGAWRQKKDSSGGGALMDMGVHCIDLIQYITGSKAVKVVGLAGTKEFSYEVEDSSAILMELEGGAYANVDAYFNIPDAAAHCRLEIYGTGGSMLAEGTIGQVEGGSLDVVLSDSSASYDAQQNRNEVKPIKIDVTFGNMYTREIEAFGNAILCGTPVGVTIADALQVQKVVESAYKSNVQGSFIDLPESKKGKSTDLLLE